MLKLVITNGDSTVDYTSYVMQESIQITRNINAPSTCSFTLSNKDSQFIMPVGMSYVKLYSTTLKNYLFTGYIQNDPSKSFLGRGRVGGKLLGFQIFNYMVSCTSDEYLLNLKYVPLLPAFVNQYQGYILQSIAEALVGPGFFDFTNCQKGDLVPYLAYDPTKSWAQYAKDFCDSSRFRYCVVNKQVHFTTYDDGALGISYDENVRQSFDPSTLSTSVQYLAPVNDVTIVGQQEAGNCREDYFIGDGFTGDFPLKHKVYGLADSENGGSVLLNDEWSGTSLNTQNWMANDPGSNFSYGENDSQALNIITGTEQVHGTSYIAAQAGLEIAGGLFLQHGEFLFNDNSYGMIGGIVDSTVLTDYNAISLNEEAYEASFLISPAMSLELTASGAVGVQIQPSRLGVVPPGSFNVTTKANKSYVLSTNIAAPAATRYNQVFRTLAGVVFGGIQSPELPCTITWEVKEADMATGAITNYSFALNDQSLPATVVYALVDNYKLNISANLTSISVPVPGSLTVKCLQGVGPLTPVYVSGNVQYIGAFVAPSGGNLPILPANLDVPQNFALGTSLGNQAAEIDSGQLTDTLNFYSDDQPGVGTRIKLQTWESQAAIARIRNNQSIRAASQITGDDGIRSAIVTNLKPLPRTSEDCEQAALAYLSDRQNAVYQGTYSCTSKFSNQVTNDLEYYPVPGRLLNINAPGRGIENQQFVVSQVTTGILDLREELLSYNITFGAKLQLDRILPVLTDNAPNALTPLDTVVQPTPQEIADVGYTYLPDVLLSTIDENITGSSFTLSLADTLVSGGFFEIRQTDNSWGANDRGFLARTFGNSLTLNRSAIDETFYIRMVTNPGANAISSRRTKAIRIHYPLVPTAPRLLKADSQNLYFDFSGDTRNVEGVELLSGDGSIVYYRSIVGSEFDMTFNLPDLMGTDNNTNLPGLGKYPVNPVPTTQRDYLCRFFNLMWDYSPTTEAYVPVLPKLNLSEGYRFGACLQLLTDAQASGRQDIASTTFEVYTDQALQSLLLSSTISGIQPSFVTNVPTTGDLYARVQQSDFISPSDWSDTVKIPYGNLIASDYLATQGSIPPSVAAALSSSGGIFTYTASSDSIDVYSEAFNVEYPNGHIDNVPADHESFTLAIDTMQPLAPSGLYGFFPVIEYPSTPSPIVRFKGPYQAYVAPAALASSVADGSVPLTAGAFVCQTAALAPTGSVEPPPQTGGGGGGSYSGPQCGEIHCWIKMADNTKKQLKDLKLGDLVKNIRGRTSRIVKKEIRKEHTVAYKTSHGCSTERALGDVIFSNDNWTPLHIALSIAEDTQASLTVWSEYCSKDRVHSIVYSDEPKFICVLSLEPTEPNATDEDHVYLLDSIWTHNWVYKGGDSY